MCQALFQKDISNLIMCASARIERLGERLVFEPLGLSVVSFKILALIGHQGLKQPHELVKLLGSSKSNITQRLKYLENRGLIIRILPDSQADGRTMNFTLSPKGVELLAQASKDIALKKISFEQAFTKAEQRIFLQLLEKLNNKILKDYEVTLNEAHDSSAS